MGIKITPRVLVHSFSAVMFGAGWAMIMYPDEVRPVLQQGESHIQNAFDASVSTLDFDRDGCIAGPADTEVCMSVGGYLKSIISEDGLSAEDARKLPSFKGTEEIDIDYMRYRA